MFSMDFSTSPSLRSHPGAEFLRHHHFLVDVAGGRLIEPSCPLPPGESLPTASTSGSQAFPLRANLLSTPQAIQDFEIIIDN